VRDPAVTAHQHQPAGQAPVVDVAGEVAVDPRQPVRVEADLLRLDLDP